MTEASNTILELKNIHKYFGGVKALHGAGLSLRRGEVHALMGENGAGKSTLVKVIMGIHQPDAGEVYFDGEPVAVDSPQVAQELGIAAIHQEASLFPDLTVAENIFIGHEPMAGRWRIDWGKMNEKAQEPLRELGVTIDPRKRVRGLSIAHMQMVEIAKALSFNAQILIMDEPTSSLTLHEVAELFRITRQLRDRGKTVLFITHRLEEVYEICDRVTVLRDGQYVDTQDVEVLEENELIQMMVGRRVDNLFPKVPVERGKEALRVEGFTKKGSFEDVSLELHHGEILGVAGLVGAHRTDLATAIFGVERPDSGRTWVDGEEVQIKNCRQAMDLGLAYVPENRQSQGLLLPMSITKNITLPILEEFARLTWIDHQAEKKRAEQFHELMEVKSAGLRQTVRQLSGGNQQKVVLAKWLATTPRILILDEPTRGIDVRTKAAVHKLMSDLAAQGMAIMMISSEMPEVLGMSDRIVVMHEGRVTARFDRQEVTKEEIMRAATGRSPAGSPAADTGPLPQAGKGVS